MGTPQLNNHGVLYPGSTLYIYIYNKIYESLDHVTMACFPRRCLFVLFDCGFGVSPIVASLQLSAEERRVGRSLVLAGI